MYILYLYLYLKFDNWPHLSQFCHCLKKKNLVLLLSRWAINFAVIIDLLFNWFYIKIELLLVCESLNCENCRILCYWVRNFRLLKIFSTILSLYLLSREYHLTAGLFFVHKCILR